VGFILFGGDEGRLDRVRPADAPYRSIRIRCRRGHGDAKNLRPLGPVSIRARLKAPPIAPFATVSSEIQQLKTEIMTLLGQLSTSLCSKPCQNSPSRFAFEVIDQTTQEVLGIREPHAVDAEKTGVINNTSANRLLPAVPSLVSAGNASQPTHPSMPPRICTSKSRMSTCQPLFWGS
jgi:hypothetical protein